MQAASGIDLADTTKRPKEVGSTPHRPTKRQQRAGEDEGTPLEEDLPESSVLMSALAEEDEGIPFQVDPPEFSVHIPAWTPTPPPAPPKPQEPLPPEFHASDFTFVPPQHTTSEAGGIQMLLDVADEEDAQQPDAQPDQASCDSPQEESQARPRRQHSRPSRYQSEEEERKEKDLRKHSL